MAYDSGSNTWPSSGEAIGKTYGPRKVGGSKGVVKTEGMFNEVVYEVTAGMADRDYTKQLPPFYLVDQITLEVEEAFAASSTADVTIDGGAGLTTDLDLATKAVSNVALTGLANTAGDDSKTAFDMVLTPNANAIASATGKARVVVRYRRV